MATKYEFYLRQLPNPYGGVFNVIYVVTNDFDAKRVRYMLPDAKRMTRSYALRCIQNGQAAWYQSDAFVVDGGLLQGLKRATRDTVKHLNTLAAARYAVATR